MKNRMTRGTHAMNIENCCAAQVAMSSKGGYYLGKRARAAPQDRPGDDRKKAKRRGGSNFSEPQFLGPCCGGKRVPGEFNSSTHKKYNKLFWACACGEPLPGEEERVAAGLPYTGRSRAEDEWPYRSSPPRSAAATTTTPLTEAQREATAARKKAAEELKEKKTKEEAAWMAEYLAMEEAVLGSSSNA